MKTFCLKLLIFCLLTISFIFPFSTQTQAASTDNSCPEGMVFIPGGTFNIGSDTNYESEKSATDVSVDSFC
ncbi:MAG: formylglycine-generating enzyme family protein, partial [Crocosphaera sp.]